jgi:excisionase family DNA binding protein
MKAWLTVAEAAQYAGVSRDTIYTACERREIRHARVGGRRAIRLKPEWIDAWLERHALDAQDPRMVGCTTSSAGVRSEVTS